MSSDGTFGPPRREFFCYQCNRAVSPPTSERVCPNCGNRFLQEYGHRRRNPFSNRFYVFSPFASVEDFLHTLRTTAADPSRAPDEDYLRLFQLVHLNLDQQELENDDGPPPASRSAVQGLSTIRITNEMVIDSGHSTCAVCKDRFNLDEEVKQMPCDHIYHSDCILPWLQIRNSCPVCRYELPTYDPDDENRAGGGMQSGGGGVAAGGVVDRPTRDNAGGSNSGSRA